MDIGQQSLYFIAGLAVFFIGQRSLSGGLQALGGGSVKHIVHYRNVVNPLINFLNGAKLTVYAFSPTMSSMVFTGLANANLLKPQRSLPMMMGMGLGTSILLLILSLGSDDRGLNLIALGLIISIIVRSYRFRTLGRVLLGLGLTFLGLSIMEEAFRLLISWQQITEAIAFLNSLDSYYSLLLSFVLGLLLALSLASSTMVYAIIIVFSRLNVVPFDFYFGLSLGAMISCLVMTFITARNEARSYAIRLVFMTLVIFLISALVALLATPTILPLLNINLSNTHSLIAANLAVSIFAFFNSFILKSFIKEMALRLFPDDEMKEQSKLKFLGEGRSLSASMSYVLVEMEISKLMDIVNRMFKKCELYLNEKDQGARALAKIKDYERIIDNIQHEIDLFIEKVISSGSGDDDSHKSLRYIKLAAHLEQLADSLDKLATTQTRFNESFALSDGEKDRLLEYYGQVYQLFYNSYEIFTEVKEIDENYKGIVEDARDLKKTLHAEREAFAQDHKDDDPKIVLYYSDMITALALTRGKARDIYEEVHKES